MLLKPPIGSVDRVSAAPARRARPARSRVAVRVLTSVVGAAALLVGVAPRAAEASPLPPSLVRFAHCPVDVKRVSLCLFSSTTSTTFQIGSTTVSSTEPATISLGIIFEKSGAIKAVVPADGTPALQSPALPLPGGLTGIPGLGGGILQVTATPQLVGVPKLSLLDLLTGNGPGLTLPIDVLVGTPTGLLGSDCTIGSLMSPIRLHLTTGSTAPPAPNKPISGSPGKLSSRSTGETTISGMKLVDNAFPVSGASNCGIGGLLDPVLDLDKGLPSKAGNNTAILAGSSYTIPASVIRQYVG